MESIFFCFEYHLLHSVQFVFFLITVAVFTCALMLAAEKEDPRCYDSPVDVFRGICEGLVIIVTIYNAVAELNQMRMFVIFCMPE